MGALASERPVLEQKKVLTLCLSQQTPIALAVRPGTAAKNMKHRAGTWDPDEVEFCRNIGDK